MDLHKLWEIILGDPAAPAGGEQTAGFDKAIVSTHYAPPSTFELDHFNVSDYLVNLYFLSAQIKVRKKVGDKKIIARFTRREK